MTLFQPSLDSVVSVLAIGCVSLFLACLLSLFLSRKPLMVLAVISGLVLVVGFLMPMVGSVSRLEYEPQVVFKSEIGSVQEAFNLMDMSRLLSSSEIARGGLLKNFPEVDIKRLIPSIKGYQEGKNIVYWSYAFEPKSFRREGGTIYVTGHPSSSNTVFFVILDNAFVNSAKSIECSKQ
jgi:hypothetical protein